MDSSKESTNIPKGSDDTSKETMLKYLRENSALMEQLKDPAVQQRFVWLLEDEKQFTKRGPPRNYGHHGAKSAGFPNPNLAPLSPLEKKVVEGEQSEEQKALRLLLKDLLGQD